MHGLIWSNAVQTAVIVVNAISLGLQTSRAVTESWGLALEVVDNACLAVYVVELALKLYADRARFFRNGWNIFDFVIVAGSLVPGANTFAVLRALRVLRVLRLISVVPALRRVVDGLGRAIPGILSVAALLLIVFYVGAVMATTLYGAAFPELFGSLEDSVFTLFQMMTLDDWANVTRTVMEEYPLAPVFFVVFVFVSALTVLNLVVAVIVDAMQSVDHHRSEHAAPESHDALTASVAELRDEVRALTSALRATRDPAHASEEDTETA